MMNNRREVSTLGHILEIKNLEVKYGVVPALKGISFYVDPGEIVALVGPNGAGKTTTLHAISGLVKGNKDSIFFKDKNINAIEPHKIVSLGISQVPEGRGIFPNLTVMENINLGHYLRRDKEGIKKDCEWVFDIFPRLKERQSQIAGTLSGGELQMLSIARALLARPEVLLLDEPSMGLAPIVVENIFRIIKKINKENKTTILLVEQNAQMALMLSDRAYVIEVGQIVHSGSSKELREDDMIRKSYLGI